MGLGLISASSLSYTWYIPLVNVHLFLIFWGLPCCGAGHGAEGVACCALLGWEAGCGAEGGQGLSQHIQILRKTIRRQVICLIPYWNHIGKTRSASDQLMAFDSMQ